MANPTTSTKHREEHQAQSEQHLGKAREATSEAMEKFRDAGSSVAEAAGHAVDSLACTAGQGMKSLGDSLSHNVPREGVLGGAGQGVANALRQGGQYLERESFSGLLNDASRLIRNHPLPAVLIGVCLGYVFCRAFRG